MKIVFTIVTGLVLTLSASSFAREGLSGENSISNRDSGSEIAVRLAGTLQCREMGSDRRTNTTCDLQFIDGGTRRSYSVAKNSVLQNVVVDKGGRLAGEIVGSLISGGLFGKDRLEVERFRPLSSQNESRATSE